MFEGDDEVQLIEKVVHINRVAKVVKGGRRFSFSAIVVVGDGNGMVGCGLGKANQVPEAIRKGIEKARKDMTPVSLHESSIPYEIVGKWGGGPRSFEACGSRYRANCGRRCPGGPGGRRGTEYSDEMSGFP